MKASSKTSGKIPAKIIVSSQICVWVRSEAGRRGIPIRRSFERWVSAALPAGNKRTRNERIVEVNILIVNAAAGRSFNRRYRNRDYATNVLSFPYTPQAKQATGLLGDLVICAPVVAREAKQQNKPLNHHYAHLTIHGVLHLLGYDHEIEADAERMEALERKLLARLDIADPYSV